MRPLRLQVEGLTSFADPTAVDFSELQLFAITGPTGAGKSSLLDAMLLALFGKVPRVGREHGQLITHGKDQLAVLLEFEAGGARYRVARRIRRSGPSQVQVERVTAAGTESLAGKARDAEAVIAGILGIDYEAFTRSVVLPQGQFDAFLKGDRKERRQILADLLGLSLYERMAKLASDRHRDRQARAALAQERLQGEFAAATPERLEALRVELQQAEQQQEQQSRRAELLAGALQRALDLRQARAEAARAAQASSQLQQQLAAARQRLQQEQQAGEQFAARRARLEQELAAAAVDPARLQQLAAATPMAAQMQRLAAALPQLAAEAQQAAQRVARAEQEQARAEAALPQLAATVDDRTAEVEAAQQALAQEQREHAAQHLRAGLRPGQSCPVCAQPVARVPAAPAPAPGRGQAALTRAQADLRAAERLRDETERTFKARLKELPELRDGQQAAERRQQEAAAESTRLAQDLAEAGVAVPERLDGPALQRAIATELEGLQQRQRRRQEIEAALQQLVAEHDERKSRLAAAAREADLLGVQLQAHVAAAAAARAAIDAAVARLGAALAGEPPVQAPQRAGGPDEFDQLQQRRKELEAATAAAHRRTGQLAQQLEQLAAAIDQAAALRAELETLTADAALSRSLAQLLQANRFQDYVQEEALRVLTEDGAVRLRALSQGRYTLRHEGGDFAVVDHWNADRERSVRTLSGGETFLASLALSLALAERIAALASRDGGGGRLECLFVDEGFGALDQETLEAAVQALEALQGGERMVGVITHLPELAARLPSRLRVENTTGRARVVLE